MNKLSHIDDKGRAKMVDVAPKADTVRVAIATGSVFMKPSTARMISGKSIAKGDVINTAIIAGVMAAKRVDQVIPLCHPLQITSADIDITIDAQKGIVEIVAKVSSVGKTGVEMEALSAVSVAGLTIYDMCKAVDKEMIISDIKLLSKKGGKSGTYLRKEDKK
ncbi:MAG: cyclic pyranopterin monophosphate synthase MoaC [Deltaproteobacteria bacterium]